MSFTVSRTTDPYPPPLTAKSEASGEQRHAREDDTHPRGRHTAAQAHGNESDAFRELPLATASPFVGRLINVRV